MWPSLQSTNVSVKINYAFVYLLEMIWREERNVSFDFGVIPKISDTIYVPCIYVYYNQILFIVDS